MIQKLQKVFHTDKISGRLSLIISFYLVFFIFGYWVWFLVASENFINFNIFILESFLPSLYFFLVLPVISFIIVFKIKKIFGLSINKFVLFILNIILIALNLFLFLLIGVKFFIRPDMFI